MSNRRVALCCTIAIVLLFQSGIAQAQNDSRYLGPVPESVVVDKDVVYGSVEGRELHLDLYRPRASGKNRPGVVFIHGGGWRGGARNQFQRQAVYLAQRGYVCVCIEYRLSGEAIYPAAVDDCKSAVRWMQAQQDTFGVDPTRVAVAGGSAGGHLAALAAVTYARPESGSARRFSEQSRRIRAAVPFNGVFDMRTRIRNGKVPESTLKFLGGMREQFPDRYAESSPVFHVDSDCPPFLLLHGTEDSTVPYEQSATFYKALVDAGVRAELIPAEGQKHGWFNRSPHFETTLQQMTEFLDREMGE